MAIALAALANCDQPREVPDRPDLVAPCGQCRNCHNIYGLNHEGLYFALPIPPHNNDPAAAADLTNEILQIKREEPFQIITSSRTALIPKAVTRQIRNKLSMKGAGSGMRVVVFDQMEKLLPITADALLKLIEEPPSDTIIILIALRADSLSETIQSRAVKVRLDRVPTDVTEEYLRERYQVSSERAQLLATISDGSLGRAVEMAGTAPGDETSRRSVGLMLFKSLLTESPAVTVAHMIDLVKPRDFGQAADLLKLWQSFIRDCIAFTVLDDEKVIANIDFQAELKRLSTRFDPSRSGPAMVDQIKNSLADLRLNVHIHGALAALALRLKACM